MPIIKDFEPRTQDISQLEGLLNQLEPNEKSTRSKVLQDLKKLRLGDKGEQNAAYLLGESYRDQDSILINGLRLVMDDQVAQIDHLAINPFGVVTLYETKNFSSGLKVDADGTFWYWSERNKDFIEMPSPIKQSERHESVLKKVFTEIGFVETAIRHFVIVDYQARLTKPKKGFENVCRPDRIDEARMESNQGLTVTTVFKALGKFALGKTLTRNELASLGEALLEFHQPITFDYAKKYGLMPKTVAESKSDYSTGTNDEKTLYTQSQLVKNLGMTNEEFETALLALGWLEKRDKYNYLTEQGKQQGIQFRKAKQGYYYFLFPASFAQQLTENQ